MSSPSKKVYLPLAKLENCAKCGSTKNPRLCAACNERTYCSPTCQKEDWPVHKTACGKTDKLQLDVFYPFIAALADSAHVHNAKPQHPALRRVIINAPNPDTRPVGFPDGSAARLVMLGEKLEHDSLIGSRTWFPMALTDKTRSKLFRRISREGQVLPILMAICLTLLTEIYTTTAGPGSGDSGPRRRLRLAYKSSPIADFGIVSGAADVKNQDKLAYWDVADPDMPLFKGQDPNDHYWLYFTTTRGETVTIDCAMFTFNMCLCANVEPYLTQYTPGLLFAPVYYHERKMEETTPGLYTERTRVSVLRNTDLHRVVERSLSGYNDPEIDLVRDFMQNLARREILEEEIDFLFPLVIVQRLALATVIKQRAWEGWPKQGPVIGIEQDPGEFVDNGLDDDEGWAKYLRKFKKSKKAGAGKEELNEAFRKWQRKHMKKGQ
ncbi:MYND-type domain-containing protein [Mycena indigotica]|uniref:MYND-type domain-containing protein n=1 Tax=Mycena indigotica TaxID=2126181 RepID=A0A8H6SHH4_9AGAR|nr:MYND-type domain-containing protein [Mycena indigotica]KAF7298781.1 MYND-type domain-containing protein [Mycena indigotica]